MRIGLDIHGVIDTNLEFFSDFTRLFYFDDYFGKRLHEIHVMTGSRLEDGRIKDWLDENGIFYTHLFSISDFLSSVRLNELEESTEENPWFPEEDWVRAKGNYAKKHKLDLVLDDSSSYLEHFTTPIARYYSKGIEDESKN